MSDSGNHLEAYLRIEGLPGESVRLGHEGEIEIESFSLSGEHPPGRRESDSVTLSSLRFSKPIDAATAEFFQALCTGKQFDTATLSVYAPGVHGPSPYLIYEFRGVSVESISFNGDGDMLSESVGLSYGALRITYRERRPDGSAGGDHVAVWSVEKGEALF